MNKFFVSTPIFYVNSSPHLGHLYSALIADVICRFQKLLNTSDVTFSTGTDEHGLKIFRSAELAKVTPQKFCDKFSLQFKNVFDDYNIKYSDYIRTSEDRHKKAVTYFYNKIDSKGLIIKGNYEGWYCVSDETFLSDNEIEKQKSTGNEERYVSAQSGHPVEWTKETNYIFKLSHFKDDLLYWLKKDDTIFPKHFHREIKSAILDGLNDLSISRPVERVPWGIPVPNDSNHTLYVWMDALVNYLTVMGYPNCSHWPPDVQVIGKDILRFHGIYWPALLIAADLEPPRQLLVHSHWKVDGVKMSKSLGNVLCPNALLDKFSVDAVRYVLMTRDTFYDDGSWSNAGAITSANSDLAHTIGNLMSRCSAKSLIPSCRIPKWKDSYEESITPLGNELIEQISSLGECVGDHFTNHKFIKGIDSVLFMAHTANKFIDVEKPWELNKDPTLSSRRDCALYLGLSAVRSAAIALQPIIPQYSDDILTALGVPEQERSWRHLQTDFKDFFLDNEIKKIVPFRKMV